MLFLNLCNTVGMAAHNEALADRRTAESAKASAKVVELRVAELESRTARLALACQALWELLSEQTGIAEERVLARMKEIDARDGRTDGRISATVMECKSCGRTVSSGQPKCVFCGHENPSGTIVS